MAVGIFPTGKDGSSEVELESSLISRQVFGENLDSPQFLDYGLSIPVNRRSL